MLVELTVQQFKNAVRLLEPTPIIWYVVKEGMAKLYFYKDGVTVKTIAEYTNELRTELTNSIQGVNLYTQEELLLDNRELLDQQIFDYTIDADDGDSFKEYSI